MGDLLMYALVGGASFLALKPKRAEAAAVGSTPVQEPPVNLLPNSTPGGNTVTSDIPGVDNLKSIVISTNAAATKTAPYRKIMVEAAGREALAKVREDANNDRGVRVEEYQKVVGLPPGNMWCAAFTAWCVKQALGKKPSWMGGSTSWNMSRARDAFRKGLLPGDYILYGRDVRANPALRAKVQPGWIWIRGTTKNNASDPLESSAGGWETGHTGIVLNPVGKSPDHFATVEGNTWRRGGKQGVYIQDHEWNKPETVIFFDPIALTSALSSKNIA